MMNEQDRAASALMHLDSCCPREEWVSDRLYIVEGIGHPMVAWCERMNSGAARMGGRFLRFGWIGCPDVLGQMKDGRLLGVEVKAAKGKLRPEQAVFLERIRAAGGVAFVAKDCRDVLRHLEP